MEVPGQTLESGYQLRILKGNQPGLVLPLTEPEYVLGRAISHQDVAKGRLYFHDQSVCLMQARLHWDEAARCYWVSHESSKGKSWVSGLPLQRGSRLALRPGSRLKMGRLVLVMEKVPEARPQSADSPSPNPDLPCWKETQEPTAPVSVEESGEFVAVLPPPPASHVDESWFEGRTYQMRAGETPHGPVAEFFENGQLKRLAYYHHGTLSTAHNQLLLELGVELGRVVCDVSECTYCEGQEMVMTEVDGEIDFFEEVMPWETWVRKWLAQISGKQTVSLMPVPERET